MLTLHCDHASFLSYSHVGVKLAHVFALVDRLHAESQSEAVAGGLPCTLTPGFGAGVVVMTGFIFEHPREPFDIHV